MTKTEGAQRLGVVEESPAYWRVVFNNPPFNMFGADMLAELQSLLARIDASPDLRVVVFESAIPGFYLAHFDLADQEGAQYALTTTGPSGLPMLLDTFVRLSKVPVATIAKVRGIARGVSSEFLLACDMRFASRENAVISQVELVAGVHPGGGGTERLPLLVGRGRALEIILGAEDFDGATAERYGYVNRALPDGDLDGFVDKLARRIASFDRKPMEAAKKLVDDMSLPSDERMLDGLKSFATALTWSETQQRVRALFENGFQKDLEFEKHWPSRLDKIVKT